jgi:hypothetical protein
MSAEDSKLEAAFQELEAGGTAQIVEEIVEEVKEIEEIEDCAKALEDEIEQLIEDEHAAIEEDKQEATQIVVANDEEEAEFETLEELQQKLQDQARANYLLLAKVRKYDTYIKQLIEMVDRLGARLKHFGLDHYF